MIGGDAIAKTICSNLVDDFKDNLCAIIHQYRPVFLRENGCLIVVPTAVAMTLVATRIVTRVMVLLLVVAVVVVVVIEVVVA